MVHDSDRLCPKLGGMGRRKFADPTEHEYQRYWTILNGDVKQKKDTIRTTESTCAPYLKLEARPLKKYKVSDESVPRFY